MTTTYTKINKASGTGYTKVAKATGTSYTKISKASGTSYTNLAKLTYKVTVDSSAQDVTTNTVPTFTLAGLTISPGANYVVAVVGGDDGSIGDPTSVTWNNTALTKLTSNSGNRPTAIWGLANPAIGNKNMTVTFSSSVNAGISLGAISLINVNTSSPTGASVLGSTPSDVSSFTTAITTTVPNSLVIDAMSINKETTVSGSKGTIFLNELFSLETSTSSSIPTPTVGSNTIGYTSINSTGTVVGYCAVEITPNIYTKISKPTTSYTKIAKAT